MELFYNKNINDKTVEFNLDGIENNHINKVLRKKEGDILTFTNGKNLKFEVEIIQLSKKTCSLKVLNYETVPYKDHLHIAISILKSTSRFENFIEKAVEIALEHRLGMTCDPVKRLVQVSFIERNCLGAIKVIYAASFTLRGETERSLYH